MFAFTKEQFAQLGAATFTDSMARFLVHRFPDAAALDRAELGRDIVALTASARRYGLDTFAAAAQFVSAAWIFGLGFEAADPTLLATLRDERLDAREKALCLELWSLAAARELAGALE